MIAERPGEWLPANVPLVERLCRHVCRDTRLSPADVDDFVSSVLLKLIDDDYAVLRAFEGRSSPATFLLVVARRALSDFRAQESGRYRPSRQAERGGPLAIELETLLRRDGKSLDEALTLLRDRGRRLTRAEAEAMARQFPERRPRPVAVPLDDEVQPQLALPPDETGVRERGAISKTICASLRRVIGALPAEDQTILRLHFAAGWSVADISRSMHIDQQRLYARLRRIAKSMRDELLAAGVDRERVRDLVGRTDVDLNFGLDDSQIPPARPSPVQERRADEKAGR